MSCPLHGLGVQVVPLPRKTPPANWAHAAAVMPGLQMGPCWP